ncbi:hypothetical protein SAMN05216480_12337 [Pustulibacterium marinum]|uniref:Uncharacterized protein n=1 Tax=Pustulibacterium marinum TaxID=1224947 RepID=A0A1I7IWI3_9FLAO|nr:hypothetical protein [Pustulibacterium marinum]SFU77278.1 hypothetical protein SAMN05216480_12337 [Pustulibacterium marinum]
MAKVDTIELHIYGEDYRYNINVNKDGLFRIKVDRVVAEVLDLRSTQLGERTLKALKDLILIPYGKFLEANTREEMYIGIIYEVNGFFADVISDTISISNHYKSKFHKMGFSDSPDSLSFKITVLIKEIYSTGNDQWFYAKKTNNGFTKGRINMRLSNQTVIVPYSDEAYQTLCKAKDGLQKISKILFNFLDQEETEIVKQLNSGQLLLGNHASPTK